MTETSQERPPYVAGPSATALVVLGDLPGHPGADHRLLGHLRVHRRRQGARHPAPAGQPALRDPGARLRAAAAGRVVRRADQPVRGGHERGRRRVLVPGRGALAARHRAGPVGPATAAAFAGVLVGATSWTVWNQSTVNEKVYTVSLLSIALVMWLVVHWGDDEPGPHRDRWLVLIAYVLALTSTNHLMGVLAGPGAGGLRPVDRLAGDHPADRCSWVSCSPWWSGSRSTTSACRSARRSSRRSTRASRSASSARR